MKYDSWTDFKYFVMGASIAAGRVFWVGEEGTTNKHLDRSETEISTSISSDGKVGTVKVKRVGK